MPINRKIYVGSGIKVKLNIVSDGFDMRDDNFYVRIFTSSGREKTILKQDMRLSEAGDRDGPYAVFTFDSRELGPGTYYMETYAYANDQDFPDNIRLEIDKKMLCTVDP